MLYLKTSYRTNFQTEIFTMYLDLARIRERFPSLRTPAIFLDNPGGTQIAQDSIDRINTYLIEHNANHGGAFETSRKSDAVLDQARCAMADFLNASQSEEIVFGPNMTSLTFNISRSLAHMWNPGDEIVVTRLDHDANITPWVMAAEERECKLRWVEFNPEDGTLNLDHLEAALEGKPRLLAVGYASNALGTINPLEEIIPMAHDAGALVYVDAVQYAPHGPIDVQRLGADFLVCSAYKFFGPHVGALYGRHEVLEELNAYRVRPAPEEPPGKFETGTQNHEGIAGVSGVLEYLEWVGSTFGGDYGQDFADLYEGRRLHLKQAMTAIRTDEFELSRAVLETLEETPGVTVYGPTDLHKLEERVPTVSFTLKGWHPLQVAEQLGDAGINVWNGNYYALAVTEQLELEESGGMVRVGPVHYNTLDEIARFGEELWKLAVGR
jgi:cysteine desulfurase family protein (TIGR01976 family)